MSLNKIVVKNLFGIFNHSLALKPDGITIVIGENGLGKTIILESITAFFGKNYDFFREIEFDSFLFYFDSGDIWEITKRTSNNQNSLYVDRISHAKNDKTKSVRVFDFDISKKNRHEARIRRAHIEMLLDQQQDLFQFPSKRFSQEQDQLLHELLYIENNGGFLPKPQIPKWFNDGIDSVHVKFIETQRTITAKVRGSESYISRVQKSSSELIERIAAIERSAADTAVILDSTYPNRLIQKLKHRTQETFSQLNEALQDLDNRRKSLKSAGLIVGNQDSDLFQINEEDTNIVGVLKLYIDDSNSKLAPYDEISRQIKLFMSIINKRFKHKSLEVSKEHGFVFKSTVKKNDKDEWMPIPSTKLSSGEQNELILFYELIFNSHSGDMILIDEPELSLHISWQNQFIDDLKEVTSINKVSIIIATHSPDIIGENWGLKIDLKGLE